MGLHDEGYLDRDRDRNLSFYIGDVMIEAALKEIVEIIDRYRGEKRIKLLCTNQVIMHDSQDGFQIQLRILISHVISAISSFSKEVVVNVGENGVQSVWPDDESGRTAKTRKEQLKYLDVDKTVKSILDGFDE